MDDKNNKDPLKQPYVDKPENYRPLWNSEVYYMLDQYLNSNSELIDLPRNNIVQKTFDYVSKLHNFKSSDALKEASVISQNKHVIEGDFDPLEIALINNLCVGSTDEAITLIPSLEAKFAENEKPVQDLLRDLAKYQDDS
ncbi:DNA-directed RNA polymerase II subunit rpb4 [Bonamia ostreae]|uniref:DNA-directed RNA polymerase II subunit rpb4 n=1 Tax=Bonamia ostreae TaxID=126728 RepID=A0ABV2AFT5_9EUKA